jgi:hypothetical protein
VTVAKSLITIAMELMDDKGGDRDRYRFLVVPDHFI